MSGWEKEAGIVDRGVGTLTNCRGTASNYCVNNGVVTLLICFWTSQEQNWRSPKTYILEVNCLFWYSVEVLFLCLDFPLCLDVSFHLTTAMYTPPISLPFSSSRPLPSGPSWQRFASSWSSWFEQTLCPHAIARWISSVSPQTTPLSPQTTPMWVPRQPLWVPRPPLCEFPDNLLSPQTTIVPFSLLWHVVLIWQTTKRLFCSHIK